MPIRGHAVSVLGERSLGAPAGARILPALKERLHDPDPQIRVWDGSRSTTGGRETDSGKVSDAWVTTPMMPSAAWSRMF